MKKVETETNPTDKDFLFDSSWFETEQIRPALTSVREPDHSEDVFSFILQTSDEAVLIDTGMGVADIRKLLPRKPVRVLLTHSHWDHVGAVAFFDSVSIFDSPYGKDRIKEGWARSDIIGYEEAEFKRPVDSEALEKFFIAGKEYFSTFSDGEVITVGGVAIQVIHTPGHTPDSVCFYLPSSNELFCGDTLYPGPQYLHLSESSVPDYLRSLEKLAALVSDDVKIMCGHNRALVSKALLERHILALKGELTMVDMKIDKDSFGKFQVEYYGEFSLRLPYQD